MENQAEYMDAQPSKRAYAYMFNSPQFFFGLFGHSGVVLEGPSGTVRLYSFHPIKNEGEPFDKGSIAHIVNEEDRQSFAAFRRACMTEHETPDGNRTRGILLSNGPVQWYERIRRVLKFGITEAQWEAMDAYARTIDAHTPRFNVISYSCQHFVNDVLRAGGVVIEGEHLGHRRGIIPNYVYDVASDRTRGVLSFEKIDFTEGSGDPLP